MKIRTDFVTNSSSSSFVVEINIIDKNNHKYTYLDSPNDYSINDGGESYFVTPLRDLKANKRNYTSSYRITIPKANKYEICKTINQLHVGTMLELKKSKNIDILHNNMIIGYVKPYEIRNFYHEYEKGNCKCYVSYVERVEEKYFDKATPIFFIDFLFKQELTINTLSENKAIFGTTSIRELCNLLVNNVENDSNTHFDMELNEYYDENASKEYEKYQKLLADNKKNFIEKVEKKVKSLSDIKKIQFNREYDAWGECADLVADNDEVLVEYATKLLEVAGEEREKVKKEMVEYIKNANIAQYCDCFGKGFKTVKYIWNDSNDIETLATRLSSNCAPTSVSGIESSEYDVETGEIKEEAKFVLE